MTVIICPSSPLWATTCMVNRSQIITAVGNTNNYNI